MHLITFRHWTCTHTYKPIKEKLCPHTHTSTYMHCTFSVEEALATIIHRKTWYAGTHEQQ